MLRRKYVEMPPVVIDLLNKQVGFELDICKITVRALAAI
jgi:FixJ family two-component response regulator